MLKIRELVWRTVCPCLERGHALVDGPRKNCPPTLNSLARPVRFRVSRKGGLAWAIFNAMPFSCNSWRRA